MAPDGRDPDLSRWLDVTRETWRAQAAWGRASLELVRSAVGGELDAAGAGRAYAEAARREGTRYWRSASRLGAEYARDLAELSNQVATGVLDDVSRARRPRGHAPTAEPAAHRPAQDTSTGTSTGPAASSAGLTLHGTVGERASGSLTVANRHPRARRIELAATPLVDELGVVVDGELVLDPPRTTVPAGQEEVVSVTCDLSAGVFERGRSYRSTITVSGGEEATVVCVVAVD